MDKFAKLQKLADKLFSKNSIQLHTKDKYKILKQTSLYLDAVIFNIVSIFCLICIVNHGNIITSKTIEVGKMYVENKCSFNYSMIGGDGRLGSATFLGVSEPMYSSRNSTEDILRVDYVAGTARPQIGGSVDDVQKLLDKYIKDILDYHNVNASKSSQSEICKLIKFHINCFIDSLKKQNKPVTLSLLSKTVKGHQILQPLK